jgi:eukaryotic-like serine/threonine-protein kinase
MPLTTGTRIGAYEILGSLGAGGMGEVYRARDTRLNRDVAIKVLPDVFATDPDRLVRFTREAQTLAALNHPLIAQIHGLEESAGLRGLVMELVDGEDLSAILARGPLAPDEALPIARQIAEALEAAHDAGIIHRDLKPANIKVRADGAVKVLDFGLAKAFVPDADSGAIDAMRSPTLTARATQMGVILGTAAYMAPEQAKGRPVDRRADIWAFGVIVYEMLTGRRPFAADTVPETLAHVIAGAVDLDTLPHTTPPHVRALLARCLVKDPRLRLRDIGEARLALDGTGASAAADRATTATERAALARREIAAWSLAALLAIAAALAWLRPTPHAPASLFQLTIPLDAGISLGGVDVALAPDGHALVLQAPWRSGDNRLHLRRLDSVRFEPLPGTEGGRSPFWSPDSRSLAFFADGRLRRFDFPTASVSTIGPSPELPLGGAWGPDGTVLFGGPAGALRKVSASGGQPTELTLGQGESTQRYPTFLPDGRRFFYVSRRDDGSVVAMLASLDSEERRPLPAPDTRVIWAGQDSVLYRRGDALYAQRVDYGRPALLDEPMLVTTNVDTFRWSGLREAAANTGLVVFLPRPDRRWQFTWYARDGSLVQPVGPIGEYTTFDLAPDGYRIIAASGQTQSGANLWLIDGRHGTATRITAGETMDVDPRWWPDGRSVLFGSLRDPARSAHRVGLTGDAPVLAWRFDGQLLALDDISRDGQWLLYHDANVPTLLARPASSPTTAEEVTVARALAGTIDQGRFSPDGRWVAYNTNESGRYEVIVVPFPPTGERHAVTVNGGVQPMWRADGRELYYLAPDGTLMAVALSPGPAFQTSTPVPLFRPRVLLPRFDVEQYAPTADGTRFLMMDYAGDERDLRLQVITDWRALGGR